jgi:hypothetical protein
MSARKSSSARRRLAAGAALLPLLALAACADYLKHSDTLTPAAGDAKAWNSVVHTTDPWPPHAANTRIGGHGERVDRIARRYLTGGADPAAPQGTTAPPPNPPQDAPANSQTTPARQ